MEERKFVELKKGSLEVREMIKKSLGKGVVSNVTIEYTPIGEKIIVHTSKPGLVIGSRGEKINELTRLLKKRFKLENPHIEIQEIRKPEFDAQLIADEIALTLERRGPLKFKITAYRKLQDIMKAGALGVEIRLSGKLPSDRARTWRFAQGYLKKTGDTVKVVNSAEARANTRMGTVGVKVDILAPDADLHDQIKVDENLKSKLRMNKPITEEIKEGKTKEEGKVKEKDRKNKNGNIKK